VKPVDSAAAKKPEVPAKKVTTPEGVRIMRESLGLCGILEPVEFRRNRIDDAERMIERAVSSGHVSPADAEIVMKKIAAAKDKKVFRVINKSDREVLVGKVRLRHGGIHVFAFPGSVPADMKIVCPGFVPVKIGDEADGNTIRITPDCLKPGKVAVTVPPTGEGVVCRIDDRQVAPGTVMLMPGAHECIYVRPGFMPQSVPFFVETGKPMKLSPPMPWTENK